MPEKEEEEKKKKKKNVHKNLQLVSVLARFTHVHSSIIPLTSILIISFSLCLCLFVARYMTTMLYWTTCRYGLDGPGIESRWGRDFPHPSGTVLGPTQIPIKWVPGLCSGSKAVAAWP
jgi:hypothetical protein